MSDFGDLTRAIVAFLDRHDWQQFHSLKNLAVGLSIEAAELQEVLLWKSDAEVEGLLRSRSGRQRLNDAYDVGAAGPHRTCKSVHLPA